MIILPSELHVRICEIGNFILLLAGSEALEGEADERQKRHQVRGNSGMNVEHASDLDCPEAF